MVRCVLALCFVVLCLAGAPASAAVISRDWKTPGDGLLTYDDVNLREWLDLTESRLTMFAGSTIEERYQKAQLEFGPGGTFQGFAAAKSGDLSAFAASAGLVPGGQFLVNDAPTRALIELVSPSYISSLDPNNRRSLGMLDELSAPPQIPTGVRFSGRLIRDQAPGLVGVAGLAISPSGNTVELITVDSIGIWMYRPIPEPSFRLSSIVGALLLIRRSRHA